MANNEQMKEILAKLDEGVKSLFNSEKYVEYLSTMSRFHNYSLRNTLLIHAQMPKASRVSSYVSWQKNFNRQVKKGERGIKILAPVAFNETKEFEKLDPVTKQPIIDENGNPVMETLINLRARFRTVSVFDVSQTDGDPLPELVEPLNGDVERYELFVDVLRAVSPLPIVFEDMSPNTDGYCKFGDKIAIRNNMSEVQTVSAILHEMAHAKLHDVNNIVESEKPEKPKARRFEEIEAESISFVVANHFGVETGANSFGYIGGWSKGEDTKDLQESLDVIRKAEAELIDSIDEKYQDLAKERGIDLTASVTDNVEIISEPTITTEEKPVERPLTALQQKTLDYGKHRASLPLQAKLNIIAKAFNSKKATIERRFCTGKWRGCTDVSIHFDSGVTLHIGTDRTPETKKKSVIDEYVNTALTYYNPDIIAESKSLATEVLLKREVNDNIIAESLGFKPYKFLNVEFNDGTHDASAGHIGWYSVTLAVDGKIINHINTGLNHDIASGKVSESGRAEKYYAAGGLKGDEVDFVFGGVGFSSEKRLYTLDLSDDVMKRAHETLEKRNGTGITQKIVKTRENKLYEKFSELYPQIMSGEYSYLKLEASAYEPLSIEIIGDNRISIMHTYTMNGDLMYDPMMTFYINHDKQTMSAHEFEQSMPPMYQRVTEKNNDGASIDGNGKESKVRNLREQLNDFAMTWFNNLEQQEHIPTVGILVLGENNEVRVTFDKDGKPIIPQPEQPEKQYDLGYGFMGNGITVWNRAEERDHDYVTVAHIATDRSVSIYDSDMPAEIRANIKRTAQTMESPALRELPPKTPDPATTMMHEYGYTYDGMVPLTENTALALFDKGEAIYLLYEDNTEGMALERSEIEKFDGMFGIEKADFERIEAGKVAGVKGVFEIYQIKDDDKFHGIRFANYSDLEKQKITPNISDYELVYTGSILKNDTLDSIYDEFNNDHPIDFTGHSLSVSDVIVLKENDNVSINFVDSVGFKELPDTFFQNDTRGADLDKLAEIPTVAELKAEVEAGKSISLMDLAKATKNEQKKPIMQKPDLLGKIAANKQRVAGLNKSATQKTNVLEVK